MKNLRAMIYMGMILLLAACAQKYAVPPPAVTPTATPTPLPVDRSFAPASPAQAGNVPTPMPTIEPTLLPGLLENAFSIQTVDGVNGRAIRKITGWEYGFQKNWQAGYQWLDPTHMVLYPKAGQLGQGEDLVPQPAVINLTSGAVWLPRGLAGWASELGTLITTGSAFPPYGDEQKKIIHTYTFEGQELAHYWGELLDLSPSGTKMLVGDDTVIDLRSGKVVDFGWYANYDRLLSRKLYWSGNEAHVYRCCYTFGDLESGQGYGFELSDLQGAGARPDPYATHSFGQWVRKGDYFLIEWRAREDGYSDYFPMFDPLSKKYYEVSGEAGIPSDWTCLDTRVSPDGTYFWIGCLEGNYLVNLFSFEATAYPLPVFIDMEWAPNSRFAWLRVQDDDLPRVLSVSNRELTPLPTPANLDFSFWWHPSDPVLAYQSADGRMLEILNTQTMARKEIPLPADIYTVEWSPTGETIALPARDGSLWLIDYPALVSVEQLTRPAVNVRDVYWSPDGTSLAFVGGPDIYIVDTSK